MVHNDKNGHEKKLANYAEGDSKTKNQESRCNNVDQEKVESGTPMYAKVVLASYNNRGEGQQQKIENEKVRRPRPEVEK